MSMNTIYESHCPEDTMAFGSKMAKKAMAGDIICLCGSLGAGKTAFAQGFAQGLGIQGHVNSPTFTLMQVYDNGRLPLYHFDLYRLMELLDKDAQIDPDTLDDIGFFDYMNGAGVTLIEWAEYGRDVIPDEAVWVRITRDEHRNDAYRKIMVE
ncbi:MAG: tRNA (adenosine(37)-N6)-threonylcarbamoyltransferase complex ATPase subunit type 1 TsaE [Defluviitaleaceae bacterium]|nr:tRNA (adenosine(37)-N6)-threonylcarbamoyltransferase complex ATPase subunit type 1 TsaE [Defluviitaleaceae bacterium]